MQSHRVFCLILSAIAVLSNCEDEYEEEDGVLTREQMKSIYDKIDADQDGKVSLEEIIAFAHTMQAFEAKQNSIALMKELDADEDGKITLDEYLTAQLGAEASEEEAMQSYKERETSKFKAADRNKDDTVDVEEVKFISHPEIHDEVLDLVNAASAKHLDVDGSGDVSAKEMYAVEDGEEVHEDQQSEFDMLDTDGNGALNLVEFRAYSSGQADLENQFSVLFHDADQDEDEMLTIDELNTYHLHLIESDAHHRWQRWAANIQEHAEL